MNNTFRDSETGLIFAIPAVRQLTLTEASKILSGWKSSEPEALFDTWKAKPVNKDWSGDIDSKKKELFYERWMKNPPTNPILVLVALQLEADGDPTPVDKAE